MKSLTEGFLKKGFIILFKYLNYLPSPKRYFISDLFQCKEKSHPRLGFSKTEVQINEILLGAFHLSL